ncbi:MAG: S-layer homology domain-containing protein [Nitriliruptor sp.]|nr:MAG: S-layer homology domain-containing protein [Nitriliruptor sp.]
MSRRSNRPWVMLALLAAIIIAAPAAATDRFGDVASDSVHHDAVSELSDAGVTAGCADGRYCPRDPVLREQMASFLVRGLPRATANDSVASLTSENDFSGAPASVTVQATGTAGGEGMVSLQGTVSVLAEGSVVSCPCEVEAFIYRDSDDAQGPSMWAQLPGEATGSGRAVVSVPVSWATTIPSGSTETFRLAVLINDGQPMEVTAQGTLTAITTPLS